jgi:1,4-dihydroxy-2-naphthoate octaprenyltransferase
VALITCSDCSKQVSDQAPTCIHCGRPMRPDDPRSPVPGSVEATHRAVQRSKLRTDVGQAIAFVGLPVALVVGMATNAWLGWIMALIVLGTAIAVTYAHRP